MTVVIDQGILYKITFPNGKIYFGITICGLKTRMKSHMHNAFVAKCKSSIYIAIRKYGVDALKIETILSGTRQEIVLAEIEHIQRFKTNKREFGYNLTSGGDGATGYIPSEEVKAKISASNKGKHNYSKKICIQIAKSLGDRAIKAIGQEKTAYEWSLETHVPSQIIRSRIEVLGWEAEKAIFTPVKNVKKSVGPITAFGKTQSKSAWSKKTGIPYRALCSRLNYGWSPEQALSLPKNARKIAPKNSRRKIQFLS